MNMPENWKLQYFYNEINNKILCLIFKSIIVFQSFTALSDVMNNISHNMTSMKDIEARKTV